MTNALSSSFRALSPQVAEDNDGQLAAKDARFDELFSKHEALKRENVEELDKKDRHHVQVRDRKDLLGWSECWHKIIVKTTQFTD